MHHIFVNDYLKVKGTSFFNYFSQLGIKDVFEPRLADLSPMTPDLGVYARDVQQSIAVNIRNYMREDQRNNTNGTNANGTNGMANGMNNGMADGMMNAMANGMANGMNNVMTNAMNNGMANGMNNVMNNGMANGNGMNNNNQNRNPLDQTSSVVLPNGRRFSRPGKYFFYWD